ncbi:MAG: L-histidine N(alpha)-methyltransferase [Acidimicrobiia bacterium]|nr:L-histidine N(alpha)-methyltransferase [Acidimicrobiia bacterium]MYC57514.1 L-histidine N(alpha)-methyltransferase [Acidimicrobiia bacterium]MYI29772.1 L-histidine N(alpha)-methyltransferase [Acidimicrobiia bacterium]
MIQPVIDNHLDSAWIQRTLRADVAEGLLLSPKELPSKWFYDDRGSELFAQITRLPEYYPTRREREILQREMDVIAKRSGAETVVELGSGTSEKTRIVLDALVAIGRLGCYVPFDTSEAPLLYAANMLAQAYQGLTVHGVVGDFEHHLGYIPDGGCRLFVMLGGTIGNFLPPARKKFLAKVADAMHPGDSLLMGFDLLKDHDKLVAAYDDPEGVTAAFNRNVLAVINHRLDADFVLEQFAHEAFFNFDEECIEMWLRATQYQQVTIKDLDMEVEFIDGERMRTEVSAKFRPENIAPELAEVGLATEQLWTDSLGDFALSLSRRVQC